MTYSRKRREWMTDSRYGSLVDAWAVGPIELVRDELDGEWHNHGLGLSTTAACEWELPEGAVELAIMSHAEGIAEYVAYRNDPAQDEMGHELKRFFDAHRGMCLVAVGESSSGRDDDGYLSFSDD